MERKTPALVRAYAAAITFSSTVMFRKRRNVWKVRAIPSFVILCGSIPLMLRPAKRMSPSVGS